MSESKVDGSVLKTNEVVSNASSEDKITASADELTRGDVRMAAVCESSESTDGNANYTKFSSRVRATVREIEDNEACGFQISCCAFQKRYKALLLQRLATPRLAIAYLCAAYFFTEGLGNGVFNVTITTVEKQFQLRTLESGLIGGFSDVGAFVALAISSYLGDKILKPVWMGWGVFLCGVGCVLFSLPQFTSPEYSYGEEALNYCGNVSMVECHETSLRDYKYAFMFAMIMVGFGAQYIQTLGAPYIDENVKQVLSSFYSGIFFCVGAIGPALGYFVGGATLGIFNDPRKDPHITPANSLWVGAWWISYVVGAIALLLFSIPVILLPRFLPNTNEFRQNREQMSSRSENYDVNRDHFGRRLLRLAKNGTFVFLTLADCMNLSFIVGFMTYAIKLGEHSFGLSDTTAAYYMGACAICASAAGYFFGGIAVTKFKLTLRGILLFVLGGSIVSFIFCFGFLFTCTEIDFYGATLPYAKENSTINGLDAECNSACGCSTDLFNPVCDADGATYFSPCHAGCTTQVNETNFTDCICVQSMNSTSVSRENCPGHVCSYLTTVILIMFVSFFTAFLIMTPKNQGTMRCVAFDERTAALSVQKIFGIILGRLLGRLAFGEALELSCLASSTDCGEIGTCRAYMRSDISRNVTGLFAAERALCVIFSALAWISYKKQKSSAKDDEDKVAD